MPSRLTQRQQGRDHGAGRASGCRRQAQLSHRRDAREGLAAEAIAARHRADAQAEPARCWGQQRAAHA
ncbi:MAG: hypothetical protein HIU82_12595 [Proteobacteria bacterium]|nr:hypothetical protein [Pseudomonadota bacterium]